MDFSGITKGVRMSFAGAPWPPFVGSKEEYKKFMARQEIKRRTANLVSNLQWRYWLQTEVSVLWPRGWTPQDHLGNSSLTSDPNEWYREWLETNVGRQGWAWDWRIGPIVEVSDEVGRDTIRIKFRKAEAATMFALRWS